MAKIYTKKGDGGETSLFSGERIPKSDPCIHLLGTLDECNASIGISLAHLSEDPLFDSIRSQLIEIQHALFDIGAAAATPASRSEQRKIDKTRFNPEATKNLELWIDEFEETLPPLKTFILPGGHLAAATLHSARTICRRAERHAIPLILHHDVSDDVMSYLNRLSDYLFVVSRMVNFLTKSNETPWRGKG